MANPENLKPLTTSKAREIGSKGGKASGEARRAKRDIRRALEVLLEQDYVDKSGKTMSGAELIALKQLEKAIKGETKAFEVVRDTVGQKPAEKIEMVVDDTTRAEMEDYFGRAERENQAPAKE